MCERQKKSSRHKRTHMLYEQQDGKCFYCRKTCDLFCEPDGGRWHPDRATIDHKRPRAKGGTNKDNLVMACGQCNLVKADKTMTEFLMPTFSSPMVYVPHEWERTSYAYNYCNA